MVFFFQADTLLSTSGEEHHHGVGFIMKSFFEKIMLDYWAYSKKNIMVKMQTKPAIFQTNAPITTY